MLKTFTSGNIAIAEGAMTAGLKFFAGYPITPSSEIMEYLAEKLPRKGGVVVQMEDEIASINAAIGASWTGAKAMTATSGPGFSLMAETIGLAIMTETPLVVVNVMRAGPSTGVPTRTSQSDVLQARWVTHGDYVLPSYAPWSVQEAYDLTIKAFNVSELLRTPVILLSDAVIAHLWEPLTIYDHGEVEVIERKRPVKTTDQYLPYMPGDDLVPPMAVFGEGYRVLVESLLHDERGYYSPSNDAYRALIKRLYLKIAKRIDYIFEYDVYNINDSDILLLSYGSTARMTYLVMNHLRKKGHRVGMVRLKTLWPLYEEKLRTMCSGKRVIVVENNMGKIYMDIDRICRDSDVYPAPVLSLELPTTKDILEAVEPWL
ncbi:MAG: 2-oxoacid:acceptor oxidoreductase subunit alpha [Desulfurococcaceae archaeon]